MTKWKVFDPESWAAFLSALRQLKETADENASAVSGLGGEFAELARLTAQDVAQKQDKPAAVPFSVAVDAWEEDEDAAAPYYCDLPLPGLTARDRVEITLDRPSQDAAWNCGMSAVCESLEGKVRLRASSAPTQALNGECWIEQGKE